MAIIEGIRLRAKLLLQGFAGDVRELARLCDIPESTAREWLHKDRLPRIRHARLICAKLDGATQNAPESMSPDTSQGYKDTRTEAAPMPGRSPRGELRYAGSSVPWTEVPVLGTVAASAEGKRGCAVHLDVAAISTAQDEFRVEVLSDSMRELARPGQFLRCSTVQPVRGGDLVIADLSDEGDDGEWVFKRYEIIEGRRCLRSIALGGENLDMSRLPRRWYRVIGVEFP